MKLLAKKPIGVFDSGLGGVSVLKSLSLQMPQESFVYLGDVARLPYGTKSQAVVAQYTKRCIDYLCAKDVKLIVIACNTATASLLPVLRKAYPVPIFGVIEPGVKTALKVTRSGQILVLATSSTVKSEAYLKEFHRLDPTVVVSQLACPLLVPLAEEGWFDHSVTTTVIEQYLSQVKFEYDTIVLGCTHYPLLLPSFHKAVGPQVRLVNGGQVLAEEVHQFLVKHSLQSSLDKSSFHFSTTDEILRSHPLVNAMFGPHCDFSVIDLIE